MAMPVTRHFTAADLAAMPDDGQRYELVRGELLVSPAPRVDHQAIVAWLFGELRDYLRPRGLVRQLLMAPADLTLGPNTIVQPDLFVADTTAVRRTKRWADITVLFLTVEVSSRSTARFDRTVKRPEYQQYGIPQYWIVDGDQRQVEVWTPDATEPVIERQRLTWRHPSLDDECVIDLVKLFDFG